jgi:signal transduction histidine kinase
LEWLSVIAMVPAPLTPAEASSLLRAVAMLTVLLVGAAGMVAYVFANDVRNDVTYVRQRIAEMAAADNDPAGAPIPIRALDQVGVLTAAFNQLVGRFAAAERRYREDLTFATALDGERSAFLAALSHELRTPLNGILGFADVLLSEVEGTLDDATREELGVIRTSASHLRSLIDDILELSALESGGLKLRREPVDVYAVAEEVVREQRPLAADKKLALDLQGSRGAIALADPHRLRQILGNIVGNAVKFTTRGGVRVAVENGNDEVVVHTIDTGPGIAPAERAAIFEEYAQAGDIATRRKGTGLGLAIARRLVAMHGGVIELESTLGQGSRFTFKLKLAGGESP